MTPGVRTKLSPPELAKRWGIDPAKVIAWIHSGELRAINARRLSDRFRRRCEVHHFDSTSTAFQAAMGELVRRVWKEETGGDLAELPEGLGQFELADEHYSIGLALQQIAPYARTGDPLPAAFGVPFIRGESPEPAPGPADAQPTRCAAPTRFYCPACGKWGRKGEAVVSAGNGRWKHVGCK